ncbi:MAG: nucleotidyl transferase AbiEii/AbiGii toxin family protein [Candidatus Hydrothermarchaeota archaeon]
MLEVDRKYFEDLSEKTRFQKDILEKVYRLTFLLKAIYEENFLRETLVLKGGTAINFIYLKISRLSIDLDFNYVSKKSKEDMLKDKENICNSRLRD